jgi:hypothetical protein
MTIVVAACFLELWLQQGGVSLTFMQVIARDFHHGTLTG